MPDKKDDLVLDTDLVNLTDQKKPEKQSVRYNLAKGSERIWARVIDMLLMLVIVFAFACLIFLTDPSYVDNHNLEDIQPFRYIVFALVAFIINFFYFVGLQRFWKGQTLGMKAFKLATYNQIFNHFTLNIVKKEFFYWILLGIVEVSLGIALCVEGYVSSEAKAWEIVTKMFSGDEPIYAIIYGILFAICFVLLIFAAVDTGVHSQRQSTIDKMSNTCVVKKVDVLGSDKENKNKNLKKKAARRNYALPGAIIDSPHDTIDSLDDKEDKE